MSSNKESLSMNTQNVFDFSTSNLILTVGGQILILVFLLMLVFFGTAPLSFPTKAVKEVINNIRVKN